MDGQNMNEKSWESFAFNSYTPFCFHDTSLTSSKILQFYQFIYLFIYYYYYQILELGISMKGVISLLWLMCLPRKRNIQFFSILWLPNGKVCTWSLKINKNNNNVGHEVPFAYGDQWEPCTINVETIIHLRVIKWKM